MNHQIFSVTPLTLWQEFAHTCLLCSQWLSNILILLEAYCTIVQKCKDFLMFQKVCYALQGCICLRKNTVKTVKLWNIIRIWNKSFLFEYIVKCNLFLWSKLYFQYQYSSLQCHMILQKWWLTALETFLIIINGKTENSKEQHVLEIDWIYLFF